MTIVSDGGEQEIAIEMTVLENNIPIADVGQDQTVIEGTQVTLDGSQSLDADGDALSFEWTPPAGIELRDSNAVQPTFLASVPGIYSFTLVVHDDLVSSNPVTVVITVITNTADAEITGEIIEDPGGEETATAEVTGELIEDTEEETADAEIVGEIEEEETADAEVSGVIED